MLQPQFSSLKVCLLMSFYISINSSPAHTRSHNNTQRRKNKATKSWAYKVGEVAEYLQGNVFLLCLLDNGRPNNGEVQEV